jgi:hypothetical protein
MKEPTTLGELYAWLDAVEKASGCLPLNPLQYDEHVRNSSDVWLWLTGFELPHKKAIETAIEHISIQEEEAFRDLEPIAGQLLRLRIVIARDLIRSLTAGEEPPFDYPSLSFRELLHWLLIEQWEIEGFHRASEVLALRGLT